MSDDDNELREIALSRVGKSLREKYRIDGLLGVGGMASVYAATHRNGRQVAIKLLHPLLAVHSEIRKRFLLEGHAANAVKHPGVVVVIDDEVAEDGSAFLVMELLSGESVEELSRRAGGALPPEIALAIVHDICDVLAVAHEGGIVHRDLKPANLFVTTDGRVKILDFGLARLRDTALNIRATMSGAVFGTPAFLPPEQAAGRASAVDARTDLWALGATLFTLLSGRLVHEGESGQQLILSSATKPARSLAAVMPDAAPALIAVVDRALAFDRERRWQSAREMQTALRDVSRELFGDTAGVLVGLTRPSQRLQVAEQPTQPTHAADGTRTTAPTSATMPAASVAPLPAANVATALVPREASARRSRSRAVLLGVAIAALLAGTVVVVSMVSAPLRDAAPTNETSSVAIPASRTAATASSIPSAAPSQAVAPPATAERPVPPPSSVRVPTPSPPPPAKRIAPDCRQPRVKLPSGKEIWKPECVHD